MGVKSLSEAIIIQSLEDISDHRHRAESLEFFSGDDFRTCARLAGMTQNNQIEVLELAQRLLTIPLKMGIKPERPAHKLPKRKRTKEVVPA